MSNQKHTVLTDALDTLGTCPIPENSGRDAIHLAVEPVIAGQLLMAGDRCKIVDGVAVARVMTSDNDDDATGIVDPFLHRPAHVNKGEKFWFVVLPRTITSLRHVWSHPAFPEAQAVADTDPHYVWGFPVDTSESVSKADMTRLIEEMAAMPHSLDNVHGFIPEQSMAMARMKEWCNKIGERYDYIMDQAKQFVDSGGDSYTYGEKDGAKFNTVGMPDWFWETYQEIVRNEVPQELRRSFFSCSC
jgi:hypothetical protein